MITLLAVMAVSCEEAVMLETELGPPVILETLVVSHGFYIAIVSEESYEIQARESGTFTWVDITESVHQSWTDALGDVLEFQWSDFPEFPVPTDLDIRVVTDSSEYDTALVVADVTDYGPPSSSSSDVTQIYLNRNEGPTAEASEAWVKVQLSSSSPYVIQTKNDSEIPSMSGSFISLVDEKGVPVTGGSIYEDDDSGTGNFSLLNNITVPESGTYYVLIRSDRVSTPPDLFDTTDYGNIGITIVYIVT